MSEVVQVTKNKNPQKQMSFGDHLEELRGHLFRSAIAVLVIAVTAFFFKDFIFNDIIFAPRNPDFFTNRLACYFARTLQVDMCINQHPFQLININLSGQFSAHLTTSIIAGLVIAFPYIIYELWQFIKPALNIDHQRYTTVLIISVSVLFSLGVLFGYYLIVPLSLNFLGTYSISDQVINQIQFESYFSVLTTISLAAGAVFELPILVYFLAKIGMVTPEFLRKYRRHMIVAFAILAAVITPPDVFSQILVMLPLMLLYEVGIVIAIRTIKNQRYSTGMPV